MNCDTLRDVTCELLDGVLPAERAQEAREHVETCGACAEHLVASKEFAELLHGEGDAALAAWAAHMATRRAISRAAASSVADLGAAAPAPRLRHIVSYAAAAAAVLVAASAWLVPRGPGTLTADAPTVLVRGERAMAGPGRIVEAEDLTQVVLAADRAVPTVRLETGAALFRVEPGNSFAVQTPEGTATVLGTSFHVAIGRERSVSVSVHSGRVRFAGSKATLTLGPGDRLEVDVGGEQHLVSRASLDELERAAARLAHDLRLAEDELKAREDRTAPAAPAGVSAAPSAVADEVHDPFQALPWEQIGAAVHALLTPAFGPPSSQRLKSLAVVYEQADELRRLTGSGDPTEAVWHPAALKRLADPFCRALAPDAPPGERAAAVQAIQEASDRALVRLGEQPVPTEAAAEQLRVKRATLVAVRDHLGAEAAAEMADSLRADRRSLSVWPFPLTDHTSSDIEKRWTRQLGVGDDQIGALRTAIAVYVDATLRAQSSVTQRLGKEVAEAILFPRMGGQGRGGFGRPEAAPEPAGDDPVAPVLQSIDVRLEIAEPRIEFERVLRTLHKPGDDRNRREIASPLFTFPETTR